ncbi:hypothetical protein SUGI_0768040 [Cryptomeria japonica]|uniref:U-box domain-containing protein 13 n=1 Tax=Cryptomeria japonica TaxID=3369 RepID=UPI002414827F|nr:U-box domain-containing protein 13 [Cryptomeria japonica]GLJ37786.1 hypothetical protein SUGI_0768040 [Cryptomeria japonica]
MGVAEEGGLKVGGRDSGPSPWARSYLKLNFFSRLFRLIKSKKRKSNNHQVMSVTETSSTLDFDNQGDPKEVDTRMGVEEQRKQKDSSSGETCSIIDWEESKSQGSNLRQAVTQVHFGSPDEKWKAADEIQRLAKENAKTRKCLAVLGVIPSLVAMLDSSVPEHCHSALQALIELANGSYTNKGLIVEARAVDKLAQLIATSDSEMQERIAILLLAVSALDKNKSILGSSGVLPELISMLESGTDQGKMASLAALYNLSTCLENVESMVANGAVQPLLKMSESSKTGERALAILGNLVVTESGRKAVESGINMPKGLIDILGWEKCPKCQELAAYILMLLAHRSLIQRKAMMREGIVPVLLELALLGSTLAQKRAMRILHCLRDDKRGVTMPVSGPVTARVWDAKRQLSSPDDMTEMTLHKRAVTNMVRQSLQRNMDHIVERANMPTTFVDSSTRLKSLICSSSSKSLPY